MHGTDAETPWMMAEFYYDAWVHRCSSVDPSFLSLDFVGKKQKHISEWMRKEGIYG
jgi:hypothetical protein